MSKDLLVGTLTPGPECGKIFLRRISFYSQLRNVSILMRSSIRGLNSLIEGFEEHWELLTEFVTANIKQYVFNLYLPTCFETNIAKSKNKIVKL